MEIKYLLVIISIIIFIYLLIAYNENNVEGFLSTFNGRMAVDDQYYYDKLFDNVIYYPNEYEKDYKTGEEIGRLLKTGWTKCKEECTGNCVEFFVSGNAHCFPY